MKPIEIFIFTILFILGLYFGESLKDVPIYKEILRSAVSSGMLGIWLSVFSWFERGN